MVSPMYALMDAYMTYTKPAPSRRAVLSPISQIPPGIALSEHLLSAVCSSNSSAGVAHKVLNFVYIVN
jgi:hypothetical protein